MLSIGIAACNPNSIASKAFTAWAKTYMDNQQVERELAAAHRDLERRPLECIGPDEFISMAADGMSDAGFEKLMPKVALEAWEKLVKAYDMTYLDVSQVQAMEAFERVAEEIIEASKVQDMQADVDLKVEGGKRSGPLDAWLLKWVALARMSGKLNGEWGKSGAS